MKKTFIDKLRDRLTKSVSFIEKDASHFTLFNHRFLSPVLIDRFLHEAERMLGLIKTSPDQFSKDDARKYIALLELYEKWWRDYRIAAWEDFKYIHLGLSPVIIPAKTKRITTKDFKERLDKYFMNLHLEGEQNYFHNEFLYGEAMGGTFRLLYILKGKIEELHEKEDLYQKRMEKERQLISKKSLKSDSPSLKAKKEVIGIYLKYKKKSEYRACRDVWKDNFMGKKGQFEDFQSFLTAFRDWTKRNTNRDKYPEIMKYLSEKANRK